MTRRGQRPPGGRYRPRRSGKRGSGSCPESARAAPRPEGGSAGGAASPPLSAGKPAAGSGGAARGKRRLPLGLRLPAQEPTKGTAPPAPAAPRPATARTAGGCLSARCRPAAYGANGITPGRAEPARCHRPGRVAPPRPPRSPRRAARPAPLFPVPSLPCAGLGLPALLAAAVAGAVALGRRRSEPLKAPRGGGGGEGGG